MLGNKLARRGRKSRGRGDDAAAADAVSTYGFCGRVGVPAYVST